MRLLLTVSLTALATALIAASTNRLEPHSSEPAEISRLDECIQKRFLSTRSFGMSRVLPNQFHGIRTFQPENDTERALVSALKQKGYEVALYLAGRGTLTPAFDVRRSRLQGPAFITPVAEDQLPTADALLPEGRAALTAFEKSGGYDIQKDGWTVAMRPLRASGATCVQCHTAGLAVFKSGTIDAPQLKIGDPLGVAMYLYRKPANN